MADDVQIGSTLIEWTQRQEQNLQRLRREVRMLEGCRSIAISRVAKAAGVGLDMAAIMIEKADAIRDALEPFDSGCRPAAPPEAAKGGGD